MGQEKAFLELGGEPLIVRTARLVRPLVASLTIIGSSKRLEGLKLRAIADRKFGKQVGKEPLQTPLVGIATALHVTKSPWNLILACDLPYLTADWLDWLLTRADRSAAQIVMPRTVRGLEPLAAAYRRECAAPIAAALARGVRKVTDAMAEFRMEYLDESEWKTHDPDDRVLKNMNTPADFEEAQKWWIETQNQAQMKQRTALK